jgi:hypothetical protein
MKYRSSNGSSYDVVYNPSQRGYGYWNGGGPGLGTWMMYDALSDTIMLNSLMSKNNYYVGSPPTNTYGIINTIFLWTTGILCMFLVGLGIYVLIKN